MCRQFLLDYKDRFLIKALALKFEYNKFQFERGWKTAFYGSFSSHFLCFSKQTSCRFVSFFRYSGLLTQVAVF